MRLSTTTFLTMLAYFCAHPVFANDKAATETKYSEKSAQKILKTNSWFQKDNLFMSGSAIYGFMSGGGLSGTSFAETVAGTPPNMPLTDPNVNANNYIPTAGANWGFEATLGYKLDPTLEHVLLATFTNLSTIRSKGVNVQDGLLFNELTQFGTAIDYFLGLNTFAVLNGPASATARTQFIYQNLDLILQEPMSNIPEPIRFLKLFRGYGLRVLHLQKKLNAYYTGLIGPAPLFSSEDSVQYTADYYGIGGEYQLGGIMQISQKVQIKARSAASVVIGYYNSRFNEQAQGAGNVVLSQQPPISGNYFTDGEMHHGQAWTPLVFNVELTAKVDWYKSKKNNFNFATEGGFGGEYILPTFANDSVVQSLGQDLVKFDNNLSLTYLIIRGEINID